MVVVGLVVDDAEETELFRLRRDFERSSLGELEAIDLGESKASVGEGVNSEEMGSIETETREGAIVSEGNLE